MSSGLAAVLAAVAMERLRAPTVCFQAGHSPVGLISRVLWAIVGRCCWPVVAAVGVTIAGAGFGKPMLLIRLGLSPRFPIVAGRPGG